MKSYSLLVSNLAENQSDLYDLITLTNNDLSDLIIYYSYINTRYGLALIANTDIGVCYIAFGNKEQILKELIDLFPGVTIREHLHKLQEDACQIINKNTISNNPLPLHIKGTDFQIKVWEALLHIPTGMTTSYQNIARFIGNKNGSRAVGSAVGKNPISCLIPCHRVIRANGSIGEYHWGVDLKQKMICCEAEDII